MSETEIYQQQCAEFRALNAVFWQIPLIMMTLNGGLWFALASLELTDAGQRLILVFAAVANVVFIVALIRLRLLMSALLARIHAVEGAMTAPLARITVVAFCGLLLLAALGAALAALNPGAVLARTAKPAPVVVCVAGDQSAAARTLTCSTPAVPG
ncbi:MAG: hypothetical protein ACK4Y4_00490 [Brevundimonas sp.]